MSTKGEYVTEKFIAALVAPFLYAFAIKWLWGLTLVVILGVPRITYWQAFGLFWLVQFLTVTPKE